MGPVWVRLGLERAASLKAKRSRLLVRHVDAVAMACDDKLYGKAAIALADEAVIQVTSVKRVHDVFVCTEVTPLPGPSEIVAQPTPNLLV
jgi:hypothetical protein